ncbi:MAG: hypothetical protein PHY42_06410 [Bacilli bacterium]|nr:hypothetical protein [Bacilli bacterium]
MKKWIIAICLLMIVALTGCSKVEVLDIPNDEKVRMMQAMDAPEYHVITAKLDINLESQGTGDLTGFPNGEVEASINAYVNLNSAEEFYFYITYDISVTRGDDPLTAVGSLFLVNSKLYLDIDYDMSLNGSTTSIDSKEYMDMTSQNIDFYSEIQNVLSQLNWEEFQTTAVEELTAEAEDFFNLVVVSTKDDYTYFDVTVDQDTLRSSFDLPADDEFASGIQQIKANLTFIKQAFKSIQFELNYNYTQDTNTITAQGGVLLDLQGAAPKLPVISDYTVVQYFSILQSLATLLGPMGIA